ncbi:MAG: ExeA family protein [Solidesulfovibrio sp. DCME]|uniref:ExeA family protein n=1 Tax=Solidesulfovibrio sp. DCME TaxID=3447380 RepID=UPI003D0C1D3A
MSYHLALGLEREPFSNSPDPDLLYRAKSHLECLQHMEIAVRLRRGLNVVLGEVGTGKTTLGRELVRILGADPDIEVHFLDDPYHATPVEFLEALCRLFAIDTTPLGRDAGLLREALKGGLLSRSADGRRIVALIVDEGQKITPECLELLRELLNFETNTHKLLQIVMFAQTEFEAVLAARPNLDDRVNFRYRLLPLDRRQTRRMIETRLTLCAPQGQAPAIFTPLAMRRIHRLTRGYPRKIVRLCHLSMLLAVGFGKTRVSWGLVGRAARDTVGATGLWLRRAALAGGFAVALAAGYYGLAGHGWTGLRQQADGLYGQGRQWIASLTAPAAAINPGTAVATDVRDAPEAPVAAAAAEPADSISVEQVAADAAADDLAETVAAAVKETKPALSPSPQESRPAVAANAQGGKPAVAASAQDTKPVAAAAVQDTKPVAAAAAQEAKPVAAATEAPATDFAASLAKALQPPAPAQPVAPAAVTVAATSPAPAQATAQPASPAAAQAAAPHRTPDRPRAAAKGAASAPDREVAPATVAANGPAAVTPTPAPQGAGLQAAAPASASPATPTPEPVPMAAAAMAGQAPAGSGRGGILPENPVAAHGATSPAGPAGAATATPAASPVTPGLGAAMELAAAALPPDAKEQVIVVTTEDGLPAMPQPPGQLTAPPVLPASPLAPPAATGHGLAAPVAAASQADINRIGEASVRPGWALSRLAARVYGNGGRPVLSAIAKANPGVDMARLRAGESLVYPAIAAKAPPAGSCLVKLAAADNLEQGLTLVARAKDRHNLSLSLFCTRGPGAQARFDVVLTALFADQGQAQVALAALPPELAARATLLTGFPEGTTYYTDLGESRGDTPVRPRAVAGRQVAESRPVAGEVRPLAVAVDAAQQ